MRFLRYELEKGLRVVFKDFDKNLSILKFFLGAQVFFLPQPAVFVILPFPSFLVNKQIVFFPESHHNGTVIQAVLTAVVVIHQVRHVQVLHLSHLCKSDCSDYHGGYGNINNYRLQRSLDNYDLTKKS